MFSGHETHFKKIFLKKLKKKSDFFRVLRPAAGRRPMDHFLKNSKKPKIEKLKMVIKNLQQTYVDKYFFLPLSVNSSCKKCFPASQTKIDFFFHFQPPAGRRPKKSRLQTQIKMTSFKLFAKYFLISCFMP